MSLVRSAALRGLKNGGLPLSNTALKNSLTSRPLMLTVRAFSTTLLLSSRAVVYDQQGPPNAVTRKDRRACGGMACRGCLECLLKLLNFLLTLVGQAMVGYGIYLLVEYLRSPDGRESPVPVGNDHNLIQLDRPMLVAVSLSNNIFDNLPKAWYGNCPSEFAWRLSGFAS